jgi:hypothetical protein
MSNETSPRRLEVVGTASTSVAAREPVPHTFGVGQICAARPDEGPDVLVLITEVSDDHVRVLLCTDDDGIATETDAVLAPRTTGRPHPLLIHGDVAGSILKARLTGSSGRIDPEIVRRIVLRGCGMETSTRATWDAARRSPTSPTRAGTPR